MWWSRKDAIERGWRTKDAIKAERETYGKPDPKTGEMKSRYSVYMPNGDVIWLCRVTTLLDFLAKPGLDYWMIQQTIESIREQWQPKTQYLDKQIEAALEYAKGARYRKSSEAAGYGTRVHNIIDGFFCGHPWPTAYDRGRIHQEPVVLEDEPLQVQNSVALWLDWWNTNCFQVVNSEQFVFNLELGYGGAYDVLLEDAECNTILTDWKSSKAIYDTHALQLVAYGGAMAAMGKGLPDKGLVLCISKEADKFEELWVWQNPDEFRQLWTRWLGLCGIKDLQDIVSSRTRVHGLAQKKVAS